MKAPITVRAVMVGVADDERGSLVSLRMTREDAERLIEAGAWGAAVLVTHPAPEQAAPAPIERGRT